MEIHPSQPVTPVGQVPPSLSDIRQCCQRCSSSMRRAWHHQAEEQRMSWQGNSSLTSSCESPMPDLPPNDLVKALLPGFREIALFLTRDQPSAVVIEAPQELRPPDLLVGPTMAMLTATWISQDKVTGITYVDTVTTSVGQVALRLPVWWLAPEGLYWKISQMSPGYEWHMTTLNKYVCGDSCLKELRL